MTDQVTYVLDDGVATITMDDGKANALSFDMLDSLQAAIAEADRDHAAVVLAGRPGRFSAGFDLNVMATLSDATADLVRSGFETAHRLLAHPRPVVVACTGHAVAMGLFLVLTGDYRIGVAGGGHKLMANEVAIGLTLPRAALEICRHRIAPAYLARVSFLSEQFDPDRAVGAGLLDEVAPDDGLLDAAHVKARELTGLNDAAFARTKSRLREPALAALRAAIDADADEFVRIGRGALHEGVS